MHNPQSSLCSSTKFLHSSVQIQIFRRENRNLLSPSTDGFLSMQMLSSVSLSLRRRFPANNRVPGGHQVNCTDVCGWADGTRMLSRPPISDLRYSLPLAAIKCHRTPLLWSSEQMTDGAISTAIPAGAPFERTENHLGTSKAAPTSRSTKEIASLMFRSLKTSSIHPHTVIAKMAKHFQASQKPACCTTSLTQGPPPPTHRERQLPL